MTSKILQNWTPVKHEVERKLTSFHGKLFASAITQYFAIHAYFVQINKLHFQHPIIQQSIKQPSLLYQTWEQKWTISVLQYFNHIATRAVSNLISFILINV